MQRHGTRLGESDEESNEANENADPRLRSHHHALGAAPGANKPPTTTARPPAATAGTAPKQWRASLDSRASSTPDMMCLSPSILALQQKYGSDNGSAPFQISVEPSPEEEEDDAGDDMDMDDTCECNNALTKMIKRSLLSSQYENLFIL